MLSWSNRKGRLASTQEGAGSTPAESATGPVAQLEEHLITDQEVCRFESCRGRHVALAARHGRASPSEGEGCGFESRRGLCGMAVGCRLGPITLATSVRFRLPPPRAVPRLRDHSLIRSWARVRFPPARPSRCDPAWPGCLLREQEVGGSNPLTSTTGRLVKSGITPGLHPGCRGFKSLIAHRSPGGEMVDARGSEPRGRKAVEVRLLSWAPSCGGEMVDAPARGAGGRKAVEVRLLSAALRCAFGCQ
jgi:hypothetical protein